MRRAPPLGATLGRQCAFHNGLFILQLVPLSAVFVLWMRNAAPPRAALRGFLVALLVATKLILLPSEPYQRLMFEFGLLSWFHLYVATCTSVALGFMAWRRFSRRNLVRLGVAVRGARGAARPHKSCPASVSYRDRSRSSTRSSKCEAPTPSSPKRSAPAGPRPITAGCCSRRRCCSRSTAIASYASASPCASTMPSRPPSAWRCSSINSACITSVSSPW